MMKWAYRLLLAFFIFHNSICYAGDVLNPHTGQLQKMLDVAEEDGDPWCYTPETLKVPNGSLTDNGDLTASLGFAEVIGLNDLSDVTITAAAQYNLLQVNGAGEWVNIADLILHQIADANITIASNDGSTGGESATLDFLETDTTPSFGSANNWGFRWLYDPDTNNLSLSTGVHAAVTEILSINRTTPTFDFKANAITTTNKYTSSLTSDVSGTDIAYNLGAKGGWRQATTDGDLIIDVDLGVGGWIPAITIDGVTGCVDVYERLSSEGFTSLGDIEAWTDIKTLGGRLIVGNGAIDALDFYTDNTDCFMDSIGDLYITAVGGDIDFANENLTTTGTLSSGQINVAEGSWLQIGDGSTPTTSGIAFGDGGGAPSAAFVRIFEPEDDMLELQARVVRIGHYTDSAAYLEWDTQTNTLSADSAWFLCDSDIYFPDNHATKYGDAQDYTIKWDESNAVHTISSGAFQFAGGGIYQYRDPTGDDYFIKFEDTGNEECLFININQISMNFSTTVYWEHDGTLFGTSNWGGRFKSPSNSAYGGWVFAGYGGGGDYAQFVVADDNNEAFLTCDKTGYIGIGGLDQNETNDMTHADALGAAAHLGVLVDATGTMGIAIKGIAAQTADMFHIMDSNKAELFSVDASGNVAVAGSVVIDQDDAEIGLLITGGNTGVDMARFQRDVGSTGIIGINSASGHPKIYFDDENNEIWGIGMESDDLVFSRGKASLTDDEVMRLDYTDDSLTVQGAGIFGGASSGVSTIASGLRVNEAGGGGANDDFVAETTGSASAFLVDASADEIITKVSFKVAGADDTADPRITFDSGNDGYIEWQEDELQFYTDRSLEIAGWLNMGGAFFPRQVDDDAMDATDGTEGEIVYNQDDNKFYGCTTTGTPATWAAFN